MEITAVDKTWANSRKRRRQEKLKQKMAESSTNSKGDSAEVKPEKNGEIDKNNVSGSGDNKIAKGSEQEKGIDNSETNVVEAGSIPGIAFDQDEQRGSKRSSDETEKCSGTFDGHKAKKPKLENTTSNLNSEESRKEPILHGSLVMRKSCEGCSVELTWMRGSGGKDSAHQVLQYLKNNYKSN